MSAEWSPTAFYRYGDVVMYEGIAYALTVAGNSSAVGAPPANSMSWVTPPPPPASTTQQSAESIVFENIRATSAVIRLIFPVQQSNPSATSITVDAPTGFSYGVNYALGLIYIYNLTARTTYGPWDITFGTNTRRYSNTFTTDATPPAPITDVVVSQVTYNSCRVEWQGGARLPEGDYDFAFNGVSIEPTTITYILGIGVAIFTGTLAPSTNYSLVVGFYDYFENVVEAPPVSFTTANAPPAPPAITPITGVNFTNVTSTSFQANWSGGSEFPNLYSFSFFPPFTVIPTTVGANFAVFGSLTPSTSYDLTISASNGVVTETSTPATVVTSTAASPVAPILNFTSAFYSTTSFEMVWEGGSTNTSYYSFTLNGNLTVPTILSSNSATFTGLSSNTDYVTIITANNGVDSVQGGPFTATTSPGTLVPAPITNIRVLDVTSSSLKITWNGGVLISDYYYFTLNGFISVPTNSYYATNANFIGLLPNTLYTVVITASNGVQTESGSINVTTSGPGVPLSPITNEDTLNITSSGFDVVWSGGDGVLADYSFTLNGNNAVPSAKTTSSATFIGLSPSTQYTLVITCDNGTSNVQSSPLSVTTLAGPPTPPPTALQSLYVIDFLLYDGAQWVICQQHPSDIGTWYLTGPNAGQIQQNTGQNAITYLKSLQAQGCKIILSFGGGGLTAPILATMFANPANTAQSIAYALLSNAAGSNPLGFAKSGTPWQDFEFDGFDMDVETNTPNPADQLNVFQNLKNLVPSKLLVAAPQAPNLVPSNAFGGNGNGNWYPFPHAYPSDTLANYNTAPGPDAWMYPPNMAIIGLDYVFVQFYNQGPSWYPGTVGTSFVPALAMWGWLCLQSTTCKVVLGFSTNDGSPIWNQSTDATAVNDAIPQANALIQTQAGYPVTPDMWLAGWGAWNSPSANDVAANIYSPAGGMPNLPGIATMLYLADQASTPNPGWVGPVPNTR